jgi:hypothetical protein
MLVTIDGFSSRCILKDEKQLIELSSTVLEILHNAIWGVFILSFNPLLGKLSINDIYNSLERHQQIGSFNFPHIKNPINIHGTNPNEHTSYMTLKHDELHWAMKLEWMFFYPTMVDAVLYFIKHVRTLLGEEWSKEIWNLTDFDFNTLCFTSGNQEARDGTKIGDLFLKLTYGISTTPNIFSSPLNTTDSFTVFIFLLDVWKNEKQWKKFGILASDLLISPKLKILNVIENDIKNDELAIQYIKYRIYSILDKDDELVLFITLKHPPIIT